MHASYNPHFLCLEIAKIVDELGDRKYTAAKQIETDPSKYIEKFARPRPANLEFQ